MKKKDIYLLAVSCVIIAVMFTLSTGYWNVLPDRIPSNFGITGEVRSYGSKGFIFLLPATGIFLLGAALPFYFYPQGINLPVKLTFEEKEQMKDILGPYLLTIMAYVMALFLYIQWGIIQVAMGVMEGIGFSFYIGFMSLFIISTVRATKKVKQRAAELRRTASED
ncbi:DUF1648 domain-containing protein [Alteribacter keqinensis]|uniref:DUF1648 domain-containing protein n=1 Tax=Alteribacter keqinensis TaxID=2483800 RepID=A0A3M7TWV9_9BACI|nr:DUF1648 domain-containing protein [Alteribacter keqinensis]RNA70120.1 DUF1648 domain-containing protein [Alteribacter keqinensis]